MRIRSVTLLLAVFVLTVWGQCLAAGTDQQFKLKPGARGTLCLNCHDSFKEKMARKVIHTPLKKKECSGCHNPHTSSHGKMLAANPKMVCSLCHASMISAKPRSVHKVVADGSCMKCHDPHSSDNKNSLVKEGKALCFTCHVSLGNKLSKVKYKHVPVESNCLSCHQVHSSDKGPSLLKSETNDLCLSCHNSDKALFKNKHMNYPVIKALCTGCHNPHGSDSPGLLHKNVHSPVAKRMCNQCHMDATSATPLKVKTEGIGLCRGCHNDMVNKTFDKNRLHWPLLSKKGCLSCHNPHASEDKGLLRAPMAQLCYKCHDDTMKRQEKNVSKHEPVAEGRCTECHDPHSSNFLFLTKKDYKFDLCVSCHDWGRHSAHPIGEKSVDPRNKNLTLGCVSCHRTHGTENKKMFFYPTTTEVCIQCHEKLTR